MKHLLLILALLCIGHSLRAQEPSDTLTASMVTCSPGGEIFELYGHEAIRIRGSIEEQPVDIVFNYGVFDFSSPNFIGRFVLGETDYYVDAVPTDWFLADYTAHGRRVVEQKLPLTTMQSRQLLDRLYTDLQPENRRYRYKYFSTNCSTRILDHLDSIAPALLAPTAAQTSLPVTYRSLIRQYNEGYPWYQAGIDLALGREIDRPLTVRQTMFVPMEVVSRFSSPEVLVPGRGDMREAPTPWWRAPLFISWLIFTVFLIVWWSGKMGRGLRAMWALLCGLVGSMLCFLIFFTVHEGVSPNLLGWWLNPLWLIPAVTLWSPTLQRFNRVVLTALGVCTATLLLFWPLLPQSTNPAFFPLMASTIIICLPPRRPRP